jgi:hypothetical protein
MSGLTPAPTKRVHDPSRVATHGVALWSAGDSPFRSARIVMALLVSRLADEAAPHRRTRHGAAARRWRRCTVCIARWACNFATKCPSAGSRPSFARIASPPCERTRLGRWTSSMTSWQRDASCASSPTVARRRTNAPARFPLRLARRLRLSLDGHFDQVINFAQTDGRARHTKSRHFLKNGPPSCPRHVISAIWRLCIAKSRTKRVTPMRPIA